jgi:hypothetical protein
VIAGAHAYDGGEANEGAVFVFLGGVTGVSADDDNDGLSNRDEVNVHGTNPNSADSDGGGLADGYEVANGFDPNTAGDDRSDPDGDRLDNVGERTAGTDPHAADTDGDGFGDGQEVAAGTDPLDPDLHPLVIALSQVGEPGNAPDATGFGSTPFEYEIGTFEVTTRQYVVFLNAVADDDPNGLFNASGDPLYEITRSGSPGSYAYMALPGSEDLPINFVSLYDAMRFVNWLENGQPVGTQDAATTEDGSYTITPAGIAAKSIVVNPGSRFALPSEDEWYKAAHYDPLGQQYFEYPAGADTPLVCFAPGDVPGTANCGDVAGLGGTTRVGGYTASASSNGTFDQGGNVWEWTDTAHGADRRIRGGAFDNVPNDLAASNSGLAMDPLTEADNLGFRAVPEPGGLASLVAGAALLLALRRRKTAAPR